MPSDPMTHLTPYNLRCEHLAAPKGLNTAAPRFGWSLSSDVNEQVQTAYEICVGESDAEVAAGRGSHWQTGKISSAEQSFVTYAGNPLTSDEALFWSVSVWDADGQVSEWTKPQAILTGLLQQDDWSAEWIARYFVLPSGREAPADNDYDNQWQARPADYLRREFQSAEIVRATAYVSALGLYEFYVNGTRVGDEVMAPGWTDYHQRAIYQSYNVTELMRQGDNAIGAILGEGWYSGRVGHNQRRAGNHYGGRPALLVQLHLHHADGSVSRVVSDENWTTTQGPICYSDFLMGEHFDARLELGDWSAPGYDDSRWQPVEPFVPDPKAPNLTAAKVQPARETIRFGGSRLNRSANGGWIYDFGQNFAGYVQLNIVKGAAKSGDRFSLRHAEILDADGELYTKNLRHAVAIDHYTANGEGAESFKPRFTFHGFRFVELILPEGVSPDQVSLTGIAIQNDLPVTGRIETGNAMVNQLTKNIMWSQRGNFLSVPTDCPQRDERLGWSADAQVFWCTAGFNMDIAGFWAKWFDDIADAQLPDGAFTDIAPSKPLNPYRLTGQPGAPGWGDGPVIMSWQHYLRYGDRQMLENAYPALKRWMVHIAAANPDFLRRNSVYNNYADWLSVGPVSNREMVGTAYWAYIATLMAKIAATVGVAPDATEYAELAERVKATFQSEFVSPDGRIIGDTQTAYLLALDFDLLSAETRPLAIAHLIEKFDAADGHLQTGFLGVKHVCRVLADVGRPDYAYRVLLNDTYPSWGFSIRHGATTIWERWDGWTPESGFQSANMNSFNHYAYGSVGEWLYARVAGIDWDETTPGFRAIRLRPLFDKRIGWVDASYEAPTGRIESAWKIEDNRVRWSVIIPPNCTGKIDLPNQPSLHGQTLSSGKHTFSIETGGDLH